MLLNSNKPLVTIAIPSYNHSDYIDECIKSIIEQDYENIELIIIDDGSIDDSLNKILKYVENFKERFIRYEIRSNKNQGITATLNEAISWAKGKYFASFDSDDIMLPDKTSYLVRNMEIENDLAGLFGGAIIIDKYSNEILNLNPPIHYYSFEDLILRNQHFIVGPSQLLRLDALKKVGGYPNGVLIDDWYMWLKLTEIGFKLKSVPKPLFKYRRHGENISMNSNKMYIGRLQVLNFFVTSKFYKKAKSIIEVTASIDFIPISKLTSIKRLYSSMNIDIYIILNVKFWKAFFKIITPILIFNHLKLIVNYIKNLN